MGNSFLHGPVCPKRMLTLMGPGKPDLTFDQLILQTMSNHATPDGARLSPSCHYSGDERQEAALVTHHFYGGLSGGFYPIMPDSMSKAPGESGDIVRQLELSRQR